VSDLVGNGGSMRVIPEDLRETYEDASKYAAKLGEDHETVDGMIVRLVERIADLSAENAHHVKNINSMNRTIHELEAANARLKQPVTNEEFKRHWNVLHTPTTFANAVLASRSEEPQTVAEQIEIVPYVACVHGSEIRKPICDGCYERWLASRSKEPKGAPK
jgi:alkanesulfonate monooxygenase SsuD/methylene tetrahydromethanopterin reductase-like flavin-dependent oxidoreductase (luciferase family)